MLWVAFFRNLNLGHRGSPVRAQLEGAFTESGASDVRSFQTNGTVVFDPRDAAPESVVDTVRVRLAGECGYDDIAPCQPVTALVPIAENHVRDAWSLLFNTFDRDAVVPQLRPGERLADGLSCVDTGPGWVLTRLDGTGDPVDPNPVIERLAGLRNTTRLLTTVVRLTASLGLTSAVVPDRPQDTPDDLKAALDAHSEAAARYRALPASHRREYVSWIEQAKRPETRARRVAETLSRLTTGRPSQPGQGSPG